MLIASIYWLDCALFLFSPRSVICAVSSRERSKKEGTSPHEPIRGNLGISSFPLPISSDLNQNKHVFHRPVELAVAFEALALFVEFRGVVLIGFETYWSALVKGCVKLVCDFRSIKQGFNVSWFVINLGFEFVLNTRAVKELCVQNNYLRRFETNASSTFVLVRELLVWKNTPPDWDRHCEEEDADRGQELCAILNLNWGRRKM